MVYVIYRVLSTSLRYAFFSSHVEERHLLITLFNIYRIINSRFYFLVFQFTLGYRFSFKQFKEWMGEWEGDAGY